MDDFDVYQIYQQLKGISLSDALTAFDNLRDDELTFEIADKYFASFGAGNVSNNLDRPYERFVCYEHLLKMLHSKNLSKFKKMHKGTAYFFLAWTAFQIRDYERGLFYMDATIVEDKRIPSRKWETTRLGKVLTLIKEEWMFFFEKEAVDRVILVQQDFKTKFQCDLTQDKFRNFVISFIGGSKNNRSSIITALYSFILEYFDRKAMLLLRSSEGGTIEPFLMHLLKGTVIFETLIKETAQSKSWKMDSGKGKGKPIMTLGNLNFCSNFTGRYCKLKDNKGVNNLQDILNLIKTVDKETAINTVYFLRNKVTHDLRWDDIFNDVTNYEKLFWNIINANFIVIYGEFISP